MKVHQRNTHESGADRMLIDRSWHSSRPLDKLQIGDILRVTDKDTLETTDWRVTELPVQLSEQEAKDEWAKVPFGNGEKYGFFPYVVRNLDLVKQYPPKLPTPRYIPSDVRIKVWLRDRGGCKRCGARADLEFDHIIPVVKGGSNSENNIELLCKSCNRQKSAKIQ